MDGVIVDFEAHMRLTGKTGDELKKIPGAYLVMPPIEEGMKGVKSLIGAGYEVWLATKPPTGIAFAYADKVQWVLNHLPELKRKIIITHDKGLLGDEGDFLVDDRPHKANCENFRGTFIPFIKGMTWPRVVAIINTVSKLDVNCRHRKIPFKN